METWHIVNGGRIAGYIRKAYDGGYDWFGLWRTGKSLGSEPAFGAACEALKSAHDDIRHHRPHLLIGPRL